VPTCERSDSLEGGRSYEPITVKVNVLRDAAASMTNKVSVAGGGSKAANAEDPTVVALLPP